jgi:nucleotide-binding universal stress UspA family protein
MKQEELKNSAKILLAIDGSIISQNTTSPAIQIAKMLNLEIFGFYVIDEELIMDDYADYGKELGIDEPSILRSERAASFEKRGQEALQWMKSECQKSGVPVTTEIGLGEVGEMILGQTQEASFLAIGRRGNGHPDSSDYLGTNFRHIAHRTKLPLLVGGDSSKPLKKLLLAYNGGERAQKALAWAKQLQNHGFFKMLVLLVQEDDGPSTKIWREKIDSEFSQSRTRDFQVIAQSGNPADEIAKTAMKSESDLIVMGGYRHKSLLEWLEGSTLDSVLRKAPLPVLVA